MFSKQNFFVALVAFFGVSMAIAGERNAWAHQQNSLNLMNFMSRSNNIMQRDPSRSLDCFNYYIPLINEIAEKYQTDFNACLKTSAETRQEAEDATLDNRNDLANRASNSCELLSNCNATSAAVNVFECYVNEGSENAKSMYAINADAAEYLAELQENLRLIENVEYKCTNETKRTYESDSAKAYDDFNSCVLGITEVPSPTKAPTTNSSPTAAPESPESPENSEDFKVAPEDKLPEENIAMSRQALKPRRRHLRV